MNEEHLPTSVWDISLLELGPGSLLQQQESLGHIVTMTIKDIVGSQQ
jgi:hypothetical protein